MPQPLPYLSAPSAPLAGAGSATPWSVGLIGSGLLHAAVLAACAWTWADRPAAPPHASDGGETIELTMWSEPAAAASAAPPVEFEAAARPLESDATEAVESVEPAAPSKQSLPRVLEGPPALPEVQVEPSVEISPSRPRRVADSPPDAPPPDASPPDATPQLRPPAEVSPSRDTDLDADAAAAQPQSEATVADVRIGIQTATRQRQHCPSPAYPAEALQQRWTGRAKIRVLVGPSGRVLQASVYRSSGHAVLDSAALEAVRGWRFQPGRALSEFAVPISFEIPDASR